MTLALGSRGAIGTATGRPGAKTTRHEVDSMQQAEPQPVPVDGDAAGVDPLGGRAACRASAIVIELSVGIARGPLGVHVVGGDRARRDVVQRQDPAERVAEAGGQVAAALSRQFSDSDIGETKPGEPTRAVAGLGLDGPGLARRRCRNRSRCGPAGSSR